MKSARAISIGSSYWELFEEDREQERKEDTYMKKVGKGKDNLRIIRRKNATPKGLVRWHQVLLRRRGA